MFPEKLLSSILDFTFFMVLHQAKEFPNNSGRPLSYDNFTDKNKMAATKKQCFFAVFFFLYWTESSPTVIQSPGFTNDYKLSISVNEYQ